MRHSTTFISALAAALVLISAAVGCTRSTEGASNPASVESSTSIAVSPPTDPNEFSGTYTVTYDDGLVRTWRATSCGPGCADVEQTSKPFDSKAQARLSGHQWTMSFSSPTETDCGDGNLFPGIATWTWDAVSLRGSSHSQQTVDACGDPAGDVFDEHSFTLTKA
jgi:hypothetical protein